MFNLVPTSASLPPSLLEIILYKTIFTGKKKKVKNEECVQKTSEPEPSTQGQLRGPGSIVFHRNLGQRIMYQAGPGPRRT